jgi:hypothetical protein
LISNWRGVAISSADRLRTKPALVTAIEVLNLPSEGGRSGLTTRISNFSLDRPPVSQPLLTEPQQVKNGSIDHAEHYPQ